jgi:hypothetical protein
MITPTKPEGRNNIKTSCSTVTKEVSETAPRKIDSSKRTPETYCHACFPYVSTGFLSNSLIFLVLWSRPVSRGEILERPLRNGHFLCAEADGKEHRGGLCPGRVQGAWGCSGGQVSSGAVRSLRTRRPLGLSVAAGLSPAEAATGSSLMPSVHTCSTNARKFSQPLASTSPADILSGPNYPCRLLVLPPLPLLSSAVFPPSSSLPFRRATLLLLLNCD